LDLSNFDTQNVNSMSSMFFGCNYLKYLDISGFNMENITEIKDLFNKTNNISYINIFDIDQNAKKYISTNSMDEWQNLTVCQNEKLLTKGVISS
jgi:surface protein